MARMGRMGSALVLRLALALLLLGAGCGAYFNTYYNASKAYRKGEATLEGASGAKAARSNYDDCLKISSKLLQFYPDSRWVDDTVLLIGQCYYRLDQHHRAIRKFDELEASYPDSPLLPRARIWRARSYLALGREDDCLSDLARMDLAELERADRTEALRVYAELYREEKSRDRLLEVLGRSLEEARFRDKADLNADMAATLEEEGRWEDALRHYNAVRRYRPAHSLLFRSWLGTLDNSLRLGRLDQVERRVSRLRKDERFYEERHALDLREGWLKERQGQLPEARSTWALILKDFPRTESSAAAAYSLGRSYLVVDDQLDSARTYLKRTASEKQGSAWADSSTRQLALLETLDKSRKEIRRLDDLWTQRRTALHPDSARLTLARSFLPSLRARRDSLVADSLKGLKAAADSAMALDSLALATAPQHKPADSLQVAREPEGRKGGRNRLFNFQRKERDAARADSLREAQQADSLRLAMEQGLRKREDSLWVAAVLDTLSRKPSIDSLRLGAEADSLSRLAFDQRFYLSEVLLQRLGRASQADSLLALLCDNPVATGEQLSRAQFAAARLKLDQGADSSARSGLRELLDKWPMSPVANAARDLLGLPRMLSAEDSAAVLLELAENRWQAEADPLASLADYGRVAERYPGLPPSATALLAAGAIAWEDLENPVLAAASYRHFLKDFPEHAMADAVRRRLGQAVEEKSSAKGKGPGKTVEEEAQQVATAQAVTDEAGAFMDPDQQKPLGTRLQEFRLRFKELGRLRLEQILE
jgi:tetratricopeptide (TPR) repeat protein